MPELERCPVADADEGGIGEALLEGLVEIGFQRHIERGGGLVEKNKVGLDQHGAGESDTLLFAG